MTQPPLPAGREPGRWPAFAAALAGFAWYLALGGASTLNPTNINWILSGDWRQHLLGWLFFRNDPWTFPLGTISSLPWHVGTSVGFTDSNPLMSLLLKPFSGMLPVEFQFIGPWLALCFVLQGYTGARLTSLVTRNPVQQWLGGCFFVLSPVLVARMGHDTLCAHWILLGLLYVGLRGYGDHRAAVRASWLSVAAVMTAAAIHPYLTAMSFVLALAGFVRFWLTGLMTWKRAAVAALATAAGMFLVWGAVGYISTAHVGSGGFGDYSADLLALVDPQSYSRLLPGLGLSSYHWEGFGFVGLGGLLVVVLAGVAIVRERPRLPGFAIPIVIACVLLGVYALSSDIRIDDIRLLRIRRMYSVVKPVTDAFRASGRFIWPVHYLILLGGLWGVIRLARTRPSLATALLAVAVVVQAADLKLDPSWSADKHFHRPPAEVFDQARGRYRHLAIFPMEILGGCGEAYHEDYVYRWMLEAYRLNLTYNSGIFARFPWDAAEAECRRLAREVESGALDPQTIYVVDNYYVPRFTRAGAACRLIDGDWICVSKDSDERFRTLVATGK